MSYFIVSVGVVSAIVVFILLYVSIVHIFENFYQEQQAEYLRQISLRTFDSMYQIMSRGWTKEELINFLHNLKQKNLTSKEKIFIYRSSLVDEQFGTISFDFGPSKEREELIKSVLKEKNEVIKNNDDTFYFAKPLKAEATCLQCHRVKPDDVLGIVIVENDVSEKLNEFKNQMNQTFFYLLSIPVIGSLFVSLLIVYFIQRGIQNLKRIAKDIRTLSDVPTKKLVSLNLFFVELNLLKNEFIRILNKIRSISIDREILITEMQILEKFIITSDAIKDWVDYVKKILVNISSIINFYFFYVVFKESETHLIVYVFHKFNFMQPDDEVKKEIEKNIKLQIANKSTIFNEQMKIFFSYEELPYQKRIEIKDLKLSDLVTITKSLLIDRPLVGGIVGIGIDLSFQEDEIKKLAVESLLATMINIIGSIKAINIYTKELEYYATRDPLTELYNQRVFWDLLNYEVERAKRHNYPFGLLMIDVDNFKYVNDTYGHEVGDKVLKELAKLIRETFRKEDIVARYGGDEFVVILPYVSKDFLESIMKRFYDRLSKFAYPVGTIGSQETITLQVSIGISIFPDNGYTAKELFIIADEIMFKAKEEGKNRYKFLTTSISDDVQTRRRHITKILFHTVKHQKQNVFPVFQPIVDKNSRKVIGYEVLMRLQDEGQIYTANQFIPIAENLGLIYELDLILLEQIAKKYLSLPYEFFLNISPKSLLVPEYLQTIKEIIRPYDASKIVFEITEREAIKDLDKLREFITELKRFKVRFAIDDFGSGFSSYLYIKEIPLDFIKIEGNFIRTMVNNDVDKVFIESVIKMSKILNIKTIAEYVENSSIYEAVNRLDIDYLQGNYIGETKINLI
ncbi:MAG: EAL domain-containing protein [Leptospiraceae bacterium]|nr:EAL domain-containing protein [Leptospiraceae bacterium]